VTVGVLAAAGLSAALLSSNSAPTATPVVTARPGATVTPGAPSTSRATPTGSAPAGGPRPTTGPVGCTIAAPATAPSGMTLYVCYSMSGTVRASGGFIDEDQGSAAFSCADWAEDGEGVPGSGIQALQAPDPGDGGVTVDGQALSFDLAIVPYPGPGSYPSTSIAQSVSLGTTESWSTNSASAATFRATVNPDGSGSVTVTNLRNDSSNGTTENASESWVCLMQPAT